MKMDRLVLFLSLLISFSLGIPLSENKSTRIYGGRDLQLGEAPYMVQLRLKNGEEIFYRAFAGAAIISDKWLLSNGESAEPGYLGWMIAVAGSVHLDPVENYYDIIMAVQHPKYNSEVEEILNDIGLLQTKEAIVFTQFVQAIPISSNFVEGDINVVLTGQQFVQTSELESEFGNNLQIVDLKTMTNSDCKKMHTSSIYEENICTQPIKGIGMCFTDEGSPLVADGVLVGLASRYSYYKRFTDPYCAVGYPDVFTRISSYRNWIKENSGV